MATRIEIEYDRQFPNAEVQEIIARGAASTSVLTQLGTAYQSLPGLGLTAYQAAVNSLAADVVAANALVDQLRVLLGSIDAKAGPLADMNKAVLRTLQGLLTTDADRNLLDQITGPTPQGPITPSPAPGP